MSDPSLADRPETYIDEEVETLREQLYEGEIMVDSATVADTLVGISTHRVLTLAPEATERRAFRTVHLPNVEGFTTGIGGKAAFAGRAVRTGIYTVLLVGAGLVVDLEGLIEPVDAPAGVGIGSVLRLVDLLIAAISLVDEFLLGLGLLSLGVTAYFVVRYIVSRDRYFEVVVTGGDPLRIPIDRSVRPPVDRLEEAVEKASNASVS